MQTHFTSEQLENPRVAEADGILRSCVHCGLCLPVCPTYQETGRESSSPRGRIYLMRGVAEGRLELDRDVAREMYFCLACRACESACPAGVRYGHLVHTMRAEIDAVGARPRTARFLQRLALRRVIGSPGALRGLFGLLRLYQRSGLQRLVQRGGLLRWLRRLQRADRLLPALPDPHRANNAATCVPVVPKSGYAIATRPRHCGSVRLPSRLGHCASGSMEVLTMMTRARAANPVQYPSGSLNRSGMSSAEGLR